MKFKSELLDKINELYDRTDIDQFLLYALTISTFRHVTPEYRYCFLYIRDKLNNDNVKDKRLLRLKDIYNQAFQYDKEYFELMTEIEREVYSMDSLSIAKKQSTKQWWEIE